jgi:hypothetical protein
MKLHATHDVDAIEQSAVLQRAKQAEERAVRSEFVQARLEAMGERKGLPEELREIASQDLPGASQQATHDRAEAKRWSELARLRPSERKAVRVATLEEILVSIERHWIECRKVLEITQDQGERGKLEMEVQGAEVFHDVLVRMLEASRNRATRRAAVRTPKPRTAKSRAGSRR